MCAHRLHLALVCQCPCVSVSVCPCFKVLVYLSVRVSQESEYLCVRVSQCQRICVIVCCESECPSAGP